MRRCLRASSFSSRTAVGTIQCGPKMPSIFAKYCDEHVCVCVSVCLSEDISWTISAIFTHFCACCLWLWLGSLPAGWRNPKGRGSFWGFLSHWQCIVQHSIRDPYKNGCTNRDAVWDDEWAWPEEQCVTWGDDPEGEGVILGETCTRRA